MGFVRPIEEKLSVVIPQLFPNVSPQENYQ
jgi:hypothetical protein